MGSRDKDAYNGVLPVKKERGFTSNDVVAKLRGILKMKRIGHTGTLDPEVTGVLPICLGKATKLSGYLTDTDKTYSCVARLGVETDTEDLTGKVLKTSDCSGIEDSEVSRALLDFIGDYDQIPPMYSAKKVGGKKLYELARGGIEIERKPCPVKIYDIRDIEPVLDKDEKKVSFTVDCSKGTYIRSLCRDLGIKLGIGASMESLVRTRACGIGINECLTLKEIEDRVASYEGIEGILLPPDHFFSDLESFTVSGQTEKMVRNGNIFKVSGMSDGRYRVYLSDGSFAGIYGVTGSEARLCRSFQG